MPEPERCENCMSIDVVAGLINWHIKGERSHYYVMCRECEFEQKIYVETEEEYAEWKSFQ